MPFWCKHVLAPVQTPKIQYDLIVTAVEETILDNNSNLSLEEMFEFGWRKGKT